MPVNHPFTSFLFSPLQIKQESFLEDINNLLNAGEVPNLYPADEKQEICDKMRQLDRYILVVFSSQTIEVKVF